MAKGRATTSGVTHVPAVDILQVGEISSFFILLHKGHREDWFSAGQNKWIVSCRRRKQPSWPFLPGDPKSLTNISNFRF